MMKYKSLVIFIGEWYTVEPVLFTPLGRVTIRSDDRKLG